MPKLIVRLDRVILAQDNGAATAQVLSWGRERKILSDFLDANRDLLSDDLRAELTEVYLEPLADWPFRIPIGSAPPNLGYLTLWVSWGQVPQVQVGLWLEPDTTIHQVQQLWAELATWRARANAFNREVLGSLEHDPDRWLHVAAVLHGQEQTYAAIAQLFERYAAGLVRNAMRAYVKTNDSYLPPEIADELVGLLGTFGHSIESIQTYLKQISQELVDREPEDLFLSGRLITGDKVKEKLRYYRQKQEPRQTPKPARDKTGVEKR